VEGIARLADAGDGDPRAPQRRARFAGGQFGGTTALGLVQPIGDQDGFGTAARVPLALLDRQVLDEPLDQRMQPRRLVALDGGVRVHSAADEQRPGRRRSDKCGHHVRLPRRSGPTLPSLGEHSIR